MKQDKDTVFELLKELITEKCDNDGKQRIGTHFQVLYKKPTLMAFHSDPAISDDAKVAEYKKCVRAILGSKQFPGPNWSILAGENNGAPPDVMDAPLKVGAVDAPLNVGEATGKSASAEGTEKKTDDPDHVGEGVGEDSKPTPSDKHGESNNTLMQKISESLKQQAPPPPPPKSPPKNDGGDDGLAKQMSEIMEAAKNAMEQAAQNAAKQDSKHQCDEGLIRMLSREEIGEWSAEKLEPLLKDVVDVVKKDDSINEEAVSKIVDEKIKVHAQSDHVITVEVKKGVKKFKLKGKAHRDFPVVMKKVTARVLGYPAPLWLDGPPGAGKTHLMEQVAEALGLEPFVLAIGPTDTKSVIVGSMATGEYREGIAYRPYKEGGLLGIDEICTGDPGVLVSINSMLSQQTYRFPNGERVEKHKDFHVVAADNTRGKGSLKGFSRNKLDAASLNRYGFHYLDYDHALEVHLCGNKKWADYVLKVRNDIRKHSTDAIYITPRASMIGAAYLEAGLEPGEVADSVLFPFCSEDLRATVVSNVGTFQG